MKAIILLATLKNKGRSNTEILVDFFAKYLIRQKIEFEIIKLVDHHIVPGSYTQMDIKDDWPDIYNKILQSEILLFATPIWWNNHSSELQRCIERLDEVYDIILFDSPPYLAVADVAVLSEYAVAAVAVARYQKTDRRHLRDLKRRFSFPGIQVFGVVINRVSVREKDYYYHQYYYYGYGDSDAPK